MGVVTRKDSKYYWLTIPRRGQRPIRRATDILVSGSNPEESKRYRALADLAFHEAVLQIARGKLGLKDESPTLNTFWARYEKTLKSDETRRRLKKLFLPALGHLPLTAIRPSEIAKWRATRKVGDQTIVRDVTALRGLLAKAREWDVIDHDPLTDLRLRPKPGREIVRYLLPDEDQRLQDALRARDAAAIAARITTNAHQAARQKPERPLLPYYADALTPMVLISLHTGIRQGELMQLHWSAVNTHAQTLTITAQTAKSKKTRHIPLNPSALLAFEQWQTQSGYKSGLVFRSPRTGQRFTNMQTSWENLLEAAGITHFRWHDLRHTFASWLVQRGVSLQVVKELMGHASIKQTERYAHLAPNQGRSAVDLLA